MARQQRPGPRPGLSTAARCALVSLLALAAPLAGAAPVVSKPIPAAGATAPAPAAAAYQRGIEALAKGDRSAAEVAFREALKLDAGHVPSMLGMGELAFQASRVEDAGKWIGQAVKAGPDNADAQASWGRFLGLKGRHAESEAALRRAAQLDARAFRPRIDLADLLVSRGQLQPAVALYREALAINAGHAGARYGLGQALLRTGDANGAATELAQAARLAPGNPLPLVALARAELSRSKPDAALAEVDKALAIQPALIEALMLKGDVLDAKGQPDAALQAFAAAAQAAPKLGLPHMRAGMVEQQRGRIDAAVAAYQRAIAADPQQASALNNLAALAVERKQDLAQAEAWALKAVSLNPRAAQFHDTLGAVQRAQGKRPAAVKTLQTAARLAPKDAAIRFHLGQALAEAGDKAQARKALQEALALSTSFPGAEQARQLLTTL